MKRDMDLVRQILLKIEASPHGRAPQKLPIDGYSEDQIGHHVYLMGEAGLLQVADTTNMMSPSPQAIPINMTWEGHDFLDAVRSDTVWNRAKDRLGTTLQSVSFGVLKVLLASTAKEMLGIP